MRVNPFKYSIGTRVREKIFLDMLKPQVGDTILDVGCGLGYFTDLLARHNTLCWGIDLDKACIDYCDEYMQGRYITADVNNIPFPNNFFDKVLCTEVLEHVEMNGTVLKEIRRVLKPDGILVASVPCKEGIFGSYFKRIGHDHVDSNSREYHWHKGYSQQEFKQLFIRHGYEPLSVYYTLVMAVEMIMGLSKWVVEKLTLRKIDSQANALIVEKTKLWQVYIRLFPVLLGIAKLEQPLGRSLKGHMIIMKGINKKDESITNIHAATQQADVDYALCVSGNRRRVTVRSD